MYAFSMLNQRRIASGLGLMSAGMVAAGLLAVGLTVSAQEPVAESVRAKTPIDTTPIAEAPITPDDREHWAFAPVVRPPLPPVTDASWLNTGIDAFILAKLEQAG